MKQYSAISTYLHQTVVPALLTLTLNTPLSFVHILNIYITIHTLILNEKNPQNHYKKFHFFKTLIL